ncbi:MAG TPA: helix-turn-helix domain-containing protein [Acidimicrobiales bacterium]|nr:helix-turn-helix domain-containing protein [Acidimicrobiales bacterium]
MAMPSTEALLFGQRLRHLRRARGLTLDALGEKVGKPAPYLSLVENGRREAKVSLIEALAGALGVTSSELMEATAPSRRARLEIDLQQAQDDPLYRSLRLPWLKPSSRVPDDVLQHVVTLFHALQERSAEAPDPEAPRLANAELRAEMRAAGNYFADIEQIAAEALAATGYEGKGAVAERTLSDLVAHFGFDLHRVQDLPVSAQAVADLRHRRIYLHQRNALPTRVARSVVLQTLGHFALGHEDPADFGAFLRQRVESNYFAGAVLAPERPAVELMARAKREGDLSAEDLKQVFYISYEMAAHRLTNLATHHLDIPVHFLRADDEGVIWKAYENDGMPFPVDAAGVIEGQRACRWWGTRQAFGSGDRFADHAQYTETPAGRYWCLTHIEIESDSHEAISLGTTAEHARCFRGHGTTAEAVSGCPTGPCCRRPAPDVAARWNGRAWPWVRVPGYVLAAIPAGAYPGADVSELYDFLDRHAPRTGASPRREGSGPSR